MRALGKLLSELLPLEHLQRSQNTLYSAVANVAAWVTAVLCTYCEVGQSQIGGL